MAWFSRKKKADSESQREGDSRQDEQPSGREGDGGSRSAPAASSSDSAGAAPPAEGDAGTAADAANSSAGDAPAEESAPQVNISMSSYRGIGAPAGDEVPAASQESAGSGAEQAPEPGGSAARRPAPEPSAPARPELPKAPAAPPTNVETVKGLRDNALVRDALAALPEKPNGAQLLGVVRQLLQGQLFLRVQGDARAQLAEGGKLSFGIARAGDKNYMLAFSSGQALRAAVQADGQTDTSAVAQPVPGLVKHIDQNDFAGLIIDNSSAPARAVIPREVLDRAVEQADPQQRIKTLLASERENDSQHRVATAIAEGAPVWVAVGKARKDSEKLGIAEARLADGTRLMQLFSHPLEVAAQGRDERALPLAPDKLGKLLRDNEAVGGVIVDPAGPLITLTREELSPVIALAE